MIDNNDRSFLRGRHTSHPRVLLNPPYKHKTCQIFDQPNQFRVDVLLYSFNIRVN